MKIPNMRRWACRSGPAVDPAEPLTSGNLKYLSKPWQPVS